MSKKVKVYDGIHGQSTAGRIKADRRVTAPHPVGPHEVPPPIHEVSMEEWTVIVKAMQQISISPQGVASKPQDFDPKADADDWARWNRERDKEISL